MKLVSWNVNGFRACMDKGFIDRFNALNADFFCLQEIKLTEGQIDLVLPGYHQFWCYAEKKGYSGTAIFTKHAPMGVSYGLGVEELDREGRMITLEYPEFFLVTCYTPNAQRELARIDHRMKWDDAFRAYISGLDARKPVIICGDLNVAHQEIDLKNPKSNRGSAGFSDQERESFQKTLDLGFSDTFRQLHPDATGAYSWWSYMFKAREKNAGWRIDYFLISDRIRDTLYRAQIHSDIFGSDHCPVSIETDLPCNGAILSPSVAPAAAPEKENTVTPRKAVLGFTGAILCLFLCLLLFWPQGAPPDIDDNTVTAPPRYNDLFTLQHFHSPLLPVINSSSSYYTSFYTDDTTYLLSEKLQYHQLLNADIIFRIDLTDMAVGKANSNWNIEIAPTQPGGNSKETQTIPQFRAIPYRLDDAKGRLAGWIVFGYGDVHAPLSVRISDVIEGLIADLTYTGHASAYSSEFQFRQCTVLTETPLPLTSGMPSTAEIYTDVGTFYSKYGAQYYGPAYYSAYIQAPELALANEIYPNLDLEIIWPEMTDPTLDSSLFYPVRQPYIRLVYMDGEMTKPCGWLIQGLTADVQLSLQLQLDGILLKQDVTIHIPFRPEFEIDYCQVPQEWTVDPTPDYTYDGAIGISSLKHAVTMFVAGNQVYATPWEYSELSFDQCIYVRLPPNALNIKDYSQLRLNAYAVSPWYESTTGMAAVRCVYSDVYLNNQDGWLVYYNDPSNHDLRLELSWDDSDGELTFQQTILGQGAIVDLLDVTVYDRLEATNVDPYGQIQYTGNICIPMNTNNGRVFAHEYDTAMMKYAVHFLFVSVDQLYYPVPMNSSDMSVCETVYYFRVYEDENMTRCCGWVFYSFYDEVTDWCLYLYSTDYVLDRRCHLEAMPDLTADTPTVSPAPPTISAGVSWEMAFDVKEYDHDPDAEIQEQWEDRVMLLMNEHTFYAAPFQQPILSYSRVVYVQAPPDILAKASYDELWFDPFEDGYSVPAVRQVYLDPECSDSCGWLVYLRSSLSEQLSLTILWPEEGVYQTYTEVVSIALLFE